MDSLESIILVLIILCIIILFKIKSNRNIEHFAYFDFIRKIGEGIVKAGKAIGAAAVKAAKAVAAAAKAAYEAIKMAAELALLLVQLPWLIKKFISKSGEKGVSALQRMHNVIAKYTDILRKMGILTYEKARDTTKQYFKIASDTLKSFASQGINTFKQGFKDNSDKFIKMFEMITKKLTDLFHRQLLKNASIWMNETLSQISKTMTYMTNTIKNTLRDGKKNFIILYKQILNDMYNDIGKFTGELNKRLNLALGSTFFKIQPYMIFFSFALFLLIGGGIFLYFYFSSDEENIGEELNN
jgi:hypothetical protein